MSSNNIIAFPTQGRNAPAQNMDEVYDAVTQARIDHVDILIPFIVDYMIARICDEGFDVTMPECKHAMALVEVALKGAMYRSVGLYHPLADLADTLIQISDPEEDEDDSD